MEKAEICNPFYERVMMNIIVERKNLKFEDNIFLKLIYEWGDAAPWFAFTTKNRFTIYYLRLALLEWNLMKTAI